MRSVGYSRVGKNPRQVGAGCDTRRGSPAGAGAGCDTRRGSPAGAGAGRTADHLKFIFSQKVLAVRKSQ